MPRSVNEWLKDALGANLPLSKRPVSLVTVCVEGSWLVQVTDVPTGIVIVSGTKAKSDISASTEVGSGVGVGSAVGVVG